MQFCRSRRCWDPCAIAYMSVRRVGVQHLDGHSQGAGRSPREARDRRRCRSRSPAAVPVAGGVAGRPAGRPRPGSG